MWSSTCNHLIFLGQGPGHLVACIMLLSSNSCGGLQFLAVIFDFFLSSYDFLWSSSLSCNHRVLQLSSLSCSPASSSHQFLAFVGFLQSLGSCSHWSSISCGHQFLMMLTGCSLLDAVSLDAAAGILAIQSILCLFLLNIEMVKMFYCKPCPNVAMSNNS